MRDPRDSQIVFISGMSGSGKSTALKALEDLGYYCVDNLPVVLLPDFIKFTREDDGRIGKIALCIDAREGKQLDLLPQTADKLRKTGIGYFTVFLECSDAMLKRRYNETRRVHPLGKQAGAQEGITLERRSLAELRHMADLIIDTSGFNVHDLRHRIIEEFQDQEEAHNLIFTLMSFGFSRGLPQDTDLVFDVRFLPNPFFIEELREHTGREAMVVDYVFSGPDAEVFMTKLEDMLLFLVPGYEREGKSYLTLAVGCTGGRHRSVAIVEALARRLILEKCLIRVKHRDLTD